MDKARRFLCFLCVALACLGTAHAEVVGISGQGYDTFQQYYQQDVDFINQNDGRHLLPLVLAKRGDVSSDGRLAYELIGDTLSVSILTDPSGYIIEQCKIVLTAPSGMEYGNAIYNDFAISGYHSYALLMAMHADPDPANRYALVKDVEAGLTAGQGTYTRQLGVYTLDCLRQDQVVILDFRNNRAPATPAPQESVAPSTQPPAGATPPLGEDEGAGLL